MNIVQQVAASIGTAVFTVLLTNGLLDKLTATTPPAEIPARRPRCTATCSSSAPSWSRWCWSRRSSCPARRSSTRSTRRCWSVTDLCGCGRQPVNPAARPVIGGRSASVTMPGGAATTYGTALVTGIAV